MAKVYIISFRSNDDRRPSKFIVLADNMRAAINIAWEHGGADFQSRYDKTTAQAVQMTKRALRVFMTVLEALAILEAATVECKQRDINTPEVTGALNFLEPYILPKWLMRRRPKLITAF